VAAGFCGAVLMSDESIRHDIQASCRGVVLLTT
jgi:hypothetical protein